MPKLLHIRSSPRGFASYSSQLADAFLAAFRQSHPDYGTEELDIFHATIPPFEAPQAAAKYAVLSGQQPTGAAEQAWKTVIDVINHFKSADMYLISSPMWNFGIPYRLKQYIDIIVQPGLTFTYSPSEGYKGLVSGKAFLMLARGGAYPHTADFAREDMQHSYLDLILRFIGITEIRAAVIESTLMAEPAELARQMEEARKQAAALAVEA